jgi:opacity protein-like surface antigen
MNKIIITAAAVALMATAVQADNFDKTGVNINLSRDNTTFSVGTGANSDFSHEANVFGVAHDFGTATVGLEFIDNDAVEDYRLTVGKTFTTTQNELEPSRVSFYATPELHYTTGDSTTKDELRFSPVVGAAFDMGIVTPYAEVGYDWKSSKGDFMDFDEADAFAQVGLSYGVTSTTTVNVAVLQQMDTDFNRTDREAVVSFNVNF